MKFTAFIKNNKILCILFPIVASIVYAPLVFMNTYYPDVEHVANPTNPLYNWKDIGRYGLVLLKRITPLYHYNYLAEAIAFFIAFAALSLLFAYFLCNLNSKINPIFGFLGSCLFLIYPTYTDQFVFQFQCFEVVVSIILIILSGILLTDFFCNNHYLSLIIATLITIFSFGIYQSTMNLCIAMYCGMLLLLLFEEKGKVLIKGAISCNAVLYISLIAYKLISGALSTGNSYITDKIAWKSQPIMTCIGNVKHYVKVVLFGQKYMYTVSLLLVLILSFVSLLIFCIKTKKRIPLFIFAYLLLSISPFIMAIIQGSEAIPRTQLSLPLAIAFLFVFSYLALNAVINKEKDEDKNIDKDKIENKKSNSKILSYLITAFALILIALNLYKTGRLIYSYRLIAKEDKVNAIKIADDLYTYNCKANDENSKPVIIIGTLRGKTDKFSYKYNYNNREYMLTSLFILDEGIAPQYYYSTGRILGYMRMLGYEYKIPEENDRENTMLKAYSQADGMPMYPDKGYIKETDDFVIVRLTDYDPYAE